MKGFDVNDEKEAHHLLEALWMHQQHNVRDMDLLLDISDNISPGLAWPPKMTTICPLGPSAVSPITSIMTHFRDEVQGMIDSAKEAASA